MGRGWCAWNRHCKKMALSIFEPCCGPRWRLMPRRKKRGLQFALSLRKSRFIQALQAQNGLEQRRAYCRSAALLRLPALQSQTDALGTVGRDRREASYYAARAANDCAGGKRLFIRRGL